MPKRISPLTDTKVRTTKPADKPQKLFDGGGLFLLVTPSGGKLWRLKYRFGGTEKSLSLGRYPETSLAEARQKRDQASALLAKGVDPCDTKKAQKATGMQETETFEIIAREWYAKFSRSWASSHAKTTIRRLELFIFPWLGARPIKTITAPELLSALRRIEAKGALETAHRVKQVCGQVFRYAIATGRAERDPSGDLRGHGFRSMASTLLNEQGWNRDAIERQLAHAERNSVRTAYNHAEFLPERKKMMQAWTDYLEGIKSGAKIIPLKVSG